MLQVHGMIIKDQENKEFVEKIENKKKKQYQSITLYSSSPSEEKTQVQHRLELCMIVVADDLEIFRVWMIV